MELFEQIRREYEHGGGTIRGIAKKLGIHRRMVREAVLSAVPLERKTPVRERPKLEPAMAFIDAVLEADKKAPRKQRHTAHRIWCRIRADIVDRTILRLVNRGTVPITSALLRSFSSNFRFEIVSAHWSFLCPRTSGKTDTMSCSTNEPRLEKSFRPE